MPLELGLFLGARRFGGRRQKSKKALILDTEPYRYQRFISDISGQDIHAHGGELDRVIEVVATWLRDEAHQPDVPGGRAIAEEFGAFMAVLPNLCAAKRLHPAEITFKDVSVLAAGWIIALASPLDG